MAHIKLTTDQAKYLMSLSDLALSKGLLRGGDVMQLGSILTVLNDFVMETQEEKEKKTEKAE